MKSKYYIIFILISIFSYSQKNSKVILLEDENGKIITNEIEQNVILTKAKNKQIFEINNYKAISKTNSTVDMCLNNGFEEYDNMSGVNYSKYFDFQSIAEYPSPSECKLPIPTYERILNNHNKTTYINQYLIPKYYYNAEVLSTTVASNYIDPYLGNIKAFGQFALKLNRTGSGADPFACIVSTTRRKTSNSFKFNYKIVMQTIMNDHHVNHQPYFKARILDKLGNLKNEFCIVADTENCIFKKKKETMIDTYTLYTPEWREGFLDLSSIPNDEEFTIQFIAARCGLTGHFSYAYIDNICLEESVIN